MFIFNGCIFLAGACLLGLGIWLKVDEGSLVELLGNVAEAPDSLARLASVSYLLIALGAVLLVIGFLGCCGAVRESRCMLMTFFIILLIIFLAEVAAAVLIFVYRSEAEDILRGLEDEIVKNLEETYSSNDTVPAWDNMMNDIKCCGFNKYTDFGNKTGQSYPPACCNASLVVGGKDCTAAMAKKSDIPGCFEHILQLIMDNAVIIGGVAVGIIGLEVAAMVVSMVLYKEIGHK